MKLIDNASGNVSQGIILSSENKADRYKLSYNCSNIGSGKSFIRIYAILSDSSYKTYFMPVQFNGKVEFELSIDNEATFLQFDVVGDAKLNGITFETVVDATMQYVKENARYWDRIKDVTSSTGKLKSELLEGIINTSLNKIYAPGYLNEGNTSVWETETEATMINPDGMYRANSKKDDGTWDWKPFTAGAGINADAIVTGILRAIDISGVSITGSTMTAGTVTGVTIEGSTIYAGDRTSGNYIKITADGYINAYRKGKNTMSFGIYSAGTFYLGEDLDDFSKPRTTITSNGGINGSDYLDITTRNNAGIHLGLSGGSEIFVEQSNIRLVTANHNGTILLDGNVQITGTTNK